MSKCCEYFLVGGLCGLMGVPNKAAICSPQALADGGLRQLRRAILRLRCVRHVPVPPPAGGRASGDLRAQGDADGAASRLHGALLPARLPGVEAGPRGLLPGRPVAGRAQHAVSLRPQLEKEHTLLYKVNGVLTLLVFFACRVALFPYLYLTYSRYASVSVGRAVLEAPWQCNLGAALLWPLQLYWMALMCRRALRLLTGRSHAKVKKTL
uniref:uncharacterized protein LOC131103352 isoform X8 n=1 Tax=Doryrhamphus excisus TaxID=161450 RepID=UPI0025AEC8EB|nr:uncharacterized protein LOC131103352 isoform X8 [Doryrhamphus excisus]